MGARLMTLDDARLAEIEARANAATPGPWEWSNDPAWRHAIVPGTKTEKYHGDYVLDKGWGRHGDVGLRGSDNEEVIDSDPSGEEYGNAIDPDSPDAAFIAHSRQDVPALVAEVRRLRSVCGRYHTTLSQVGDVLMAEIARRPP